METYDPSKVGSRISWGRSHTIYRYGDGEVIRFPFGEKIVWGSHLQQRLERDSAVCKRYLGEYALDTRLVHNQFSNEVATVQPYITGHYLSKADLADPELKRQFEEFMTRYDAMLRDGCAPIDLAGQGGVFRRRLSNIMVLPNKTLRLFDAAVMDSSDFEHFAFLVPLVRKLVVRRQMATIRYLRS